MHKRIIRKWRPPLWLVLGGTLAAVFFLPLIGIGYFRIAGGVLGWAEASWMIFWMALVATVVLGFLLWRLVLRPVRALTDYAATVTQGSQAHAPEHYGTPELTQLGAAVSKMSETLLGREETIRSYADHATHELKSPLTVIRGAVELLEQPSLPVADQKQLLARISSSLARMQSLLEAQRRLAHAQDPMPAGHCMVSDVAAGIDVLCDGPVPLSGDLLQLVLAHLIANAVENGATQITATVKGATIVVEDNGHGISKGNQDRIFDPFFTTRRDDGGTGMGLPIVQRLLAQQGAMIALRAVQPEQGAAFVITWDQN